MKIEDLKSVLTEQQFEGFKKYLETDKKRFYSDVLKKTVHARAKKRSDILQIGDSDIYRTWHGEGIRNILSDGELRTLEQQTNTQWLTEEQERLQFAIEHPETFEPTKRIR